MCVRLGGDRGPTRRSGITGMRNKEGEEEIVGVIVVVDKGADVDRSGEGGGLNYA